MGVETEKKVDELRGDIGAIRQGLTPSFRKPQSSPPKNKPLSQEMHLKIPLSSHGLKLSNSKPGCKVSALFCEIDTTNGFLTSSSIR
jgi:hypothetical protein